MHLRDIGVKPLTVRGHLVKSKERTLSRLGLNWTLLSASFGEVAVRRDDFTTSPDFLRTIVGVLREIVILVLFGDFVEALETPSCLERREGRYEV